MLTFREVDLVVRLPPRGHLGYHCPQQDVQSVEAVMEVLGPVSLTTMKITPSVLSARYVKRSGWCFTSISWGNLHIDPMSRYYV